MLTGFNGRPQVHRPEARRSAEQDDVGGGNDALESVEAGKAALLRHIDLVRVILAQAALERPQTGFHLVGEGVAQGDQFDIGIGANGLFGGAGAAAAAADQADAEKVAAGGVDRHRRRGGEGAGGGGRLAEELPARRGGRGGLHCGYLACQKGPSPL
jgi:hypothetical protein